MLPLKTKYYLENNYLHRCSKTKLFSELCSLDIKVLSILANYDTRDSFLRPTGTE